jgi:MscS family membrane protein
LPSGVISQKNLNLVPHVISIAPPVPSFGILAGVLTEVNKTRFRYGGKVMAEKKADLRAMACLRVFSFALFCAVLPVDAMGQEASRPETASTERDSEMGSPDDTVPRGAVRAYLEAARVGKYEEAVRYLDLSFVAPEEREDRGLALARQLRVVLERTLWIDLQDMSLDPEGDLEDGLAPDLDRVGTIELENGSVDILVKRIQRDGEPAVWKFAAATVEQVPLLYETYGYGVLGEVLPEAFFTIRFFEIELWQWLGILLILSIAVLLSWVVTWILHRAAHRLASRTESKLDERLVDGGVRPVHYGLTLAFFSVGTRFLGLSVPVHDFLTLVEHLVAVVVVTWLLLRLFDVISEVIAERLEATEEKAALAVLPMGRRAVKLIVVALAAIGIFQNLGFNVTGVLAGLGVGGIAVALAAQKSIENLFGGLTLSFDQPVRVGDYCRFGDKMGTVEDVGLRSTRIRTPDRTLITVPNSELSQTPIENFGARDRIRIYNILGFRYETSPDQLRYLLSELRNLFWAHPRIENDTVRVRFVGFGAYSLDVELFTYVLTSDWRDFLAVREDLFLRIMDIVKTSGTGFAFPSQTSYLCRDQGLEEQASRESEAQVHQWREEERLPFPTLPEEMIAQLQDTLDYPPVGSFRAKIVEGEEAL